MYYKTYTIIICLTVRFRVAIKICFTERIEIKVCMNCSQFLLKEKLNFRKLIQTLLSAYQRQRFFIKKVFLRKI
jgi:hypothetical protein